MNTLKFPIGVTDYKELVTGGYIHLDKTKWIEAVHYAGYTGFFREPRFGKSLFISMLEYFFDINQKHQFEMLFGNTYIGKNPLKTANIYRVLKLDFSKVYVSTDETTKNGFNKVIHQAIIDYLKKYPEVNQPEYAHHFTEDNDPNEKITYLTMKHLYKEHNLCILVDEYDRLMRKYAKRLYEKEEYFKLSYIRSFFANIKIATGSGVVDKIFMTGQKFISLDGFTSGFNIMYILNGGLEEKEFMAFSKEEVLHLIRLVPGTKNKEEELLDRIGQWHKEYHYYPLEYAIRKSDILGQYNPTVVNQFLQYYLDHQTPPDDSVSLI